VSFEFQSIAIVGAGAIGLYYGARLAQAGEDVRFLLRSDYDAVRSQGIRIESTAGDFHLLPDQVKAYRTPQEIGQVDLVIVAWKTTSNALFSEVLPPLLHERTQVLTLQNGLGNCEEISRMVPPERIMGGLCFVCINRLGQGHASHTGGGRITIGEYVQSQMGRAEAVARRFSAAGISCDAAPLLAEAQWKKLIWNVPFNGLSIVEGCITTDVLLSRPEVEARIRLLMREVIVAARLQGLSLEDALMDLNIDRTRPMGPYRPSSMIDFVEGREIELEAIWGEPLRRALAVGAEMPELSRLYLELRQFVESA
jgi:2-dehydropantoate 2-reductase